MPDAETGGAMTINASIRGAPDQPLVNGRLDVSRGSLRFADITTGLSAASGVILFSGNQATIQNFRDRKSTRLNSSHLKLSRMPSSA